VFGSPSGVLSVYAGCTELFALALFKCLPRDLPEIDFDVSGPVAAAVICHVEMVF